MTAPDSPRFFATPDDFRDWLAAYGATTDALIVGFHRVGCGTKSIT